LLKKQLFRGIASAIYTKYTDLFLQAQLLGSDVWLSKQPFRNGFFTQKNAGTTVWLTMQRGGGEGVSVRKTVAILFSLLPHEHRFSLCYALCDLCPLDTGRPYFGGQQWLRCFAQNRLAIPLFRPPVLGHL